MVFEGDSLKGYKLDFKNDKLVKVELPNVEECKVGKWIEIWDEDHLVVLAYQCSECETMRNAKNKLLRRLWGRNER